MKRFIQAWQKWDVRGWQGRKPLWPLYAILMLAIIAVLLRPVWAQAPSPTYFYVATTVDSNGLESVFSNEATATFGQGQHIVNLSWTAATVPPGGVTIAGYNMYRGKVSGGPYTKINATLITSGVTYTDTFVPPNAPSGLKAPTQ